MKKLIYLVLFILIGNAVFGQSWNIITGKNEYTDSARYRKLKNNATGDSILSTDITGKLKQILKPTGIISPGIDSITLHGDTLCQWAFGTPTCFPLGDYFAYASLNFDSTRIIFYNFNGEPLDSVYLKHSIVRAGAGIQIDISGPPYADTATISATGSGGGASLQSATDSSILLGVTPYMNLHGETLGIDSTSLDVTAYDGAQTGSLSIKSYEAEMGTVDGDIESFIATGSDQIQLRTLNNSSGDNQSISIGEGFVEFNGNESGITRSHVSINSPDTIATTPAHTWGARPTANGIEFVLYPTPSGGGSGGISQLGTPAYGLTLVNDSTYDVDSSVIATRSRLSNELGLKLNKTDSVSGIANNYVTQYQRKKTSDSLLALIGLKLNISDTASMLLPYRNQINSNTASILTKLNISDTAAMLSAYKTSYPRQSVSLTTSGTGVATYNNATGVFNIPAPITIQTKWPLRVFAGIGGAVDTLGSVYSSATQSGFLDSLSYKRFDSIANIVQNDSAFINIISRGLSTGQRNFKGLLLSNPTTGSVQNTPAVVWQGFTSISAVITPFYYRLYGNGTTNNGNFLLQYSNDSLTWVTKATFGSDGAFTVTGGLTAASVLTNGGTSSFANPGFIIDNAGHVIFGSNATATIGPYTNIESRNPQRAFLMRHSTIDRNKMTTGVYKVAIISGGTGYTTGNHALTNVVGSGIGQTAAITAVAGVITAVNPIAAYAGYNYKVGDTLSDAIGGTGASFRVTQLTGDTAFGLHTYDSTLKKPVWWNKSTNTWDTWVTDSSASKQSILSGTGAATSFTIAHGLTGVTSASKVFVTARTAAALGITWVDLDATNITINYTVAPVLGANNIKIDWQINR